MQREPRTIVERAERARAPEPIAPAAGITPRFLPKDMPWRMRTLPLDHRGYPVPWFVAWLVDGRPVTPGLGKPNFRVVDPRKLVRAVRERRCWLCGEPLGVHMAFVLGPMCAVTRRSSEPPSHPDCATFAMSACPFLSNPHMVRNEAGLPAERLPPAGIHIDRNPGAMALWLCKSYRLERVGNDGLGEPGTLFVVGGAENVKWYAEGKPATREQIDAALIAGLPALQQVAERQGPASVDRVGAACRKPRAISPGTLSETRCFVMSDATNPSSLTGQITELERERTMRKRVYPRWVEAGKLSEATVLRRAIALDAAIATLMELRAAREPPANEPQRLI